ncbi:MAG: hypothetical protein JW820_19820 [Spirochaetales bacterium]|nr:hypothetical protein [Spirochaetales bacterium]
MASRWVRLPRLRWRFVVLLAACLLLSAVAGVYFVRYLAKPNTGLVVNFPEAVARDGRLLFAPKTPFSPAVAAGLRPNQDQILAVDGVRVRTVRDLVEADAAVRDFGPVVVEVLRNGSQRLELSIQPVFTLTRPDWLFSLVFCAALAFTAFYLVIHRSEDTASVLIALAALFYLVFTAVKPFYYENRLANLLVHFGKLTAWLMVFFALYFPRPRGSRALRLILIAVILGAYLLFTVARLHYFARWASTGADLWLSRYRFLGQLGNVSDGIAFGLYAMLLIGAYLRLASGQEKRQIEWILAGFLIAIPPYFFLDQLPLILGEPPGLRISMGSFANLFLAFVPLFFLVGLLRRRVFNLRFFLGRYAVYAVLVLLLLGLFTVLYEPAERLFVSNYGIPDRMAAFLVTTLLFLVLVPVRYGLSALVDRLFFRRHRERGVPYSVRLEARNRELELALEQLSRESRRSFRERAFPEIRGMLRGIASRIEAPAARIVAAVGQARRHLGPLSPGDRVSGGGGWGSPEELADPGGPVNPEGRDDPEELAALERLLTQSLEDAAEIREFLRKLTQMIGPHAPAPARVNAAHFLAAVRTEIRRRFPELEVETPVPVRASVLCHPEEILQVLVHIAQNAVESLTPPEIGIALKVEARKDGVAIVVEDSGTGIDSRTLGRAFEPFFSTKRGHDGLGLYLCRLIVERNGGSLRLESRGRGGTRAEVLLPAGQDDPPETPEAR